MKLDAALTIVIAMLLAAVIALSVLCIYQQRAIDWLVGQAVETSRHQAQQYQEHLRQRHQLDQLRLELGRMQNWRVDMTLRQRMGDRVADRYHARMRADALEAQ